MRARVGLGLLVVVATGCQPDSATSARSDGVSASEEGCEWLSASEPVPADVPICAVGFREVVRLEGSVDGTIPNAPVRAFRDGTYITGTYSRGRLALWGPDGKLLDVLGKGPGNGPGEFDYAYATGLVPTSEDAFVVFGPPPLVHEYSRAEGFVRSLRLPAQGSVSSAVAYGDQMILSVAADEGWLAYRIDGDSVQEMGLRLGSGGSIPLLTAAEDVGVWSANIDRHVLRRHLWPGGTTADSLVLSREWSSGAGESETIFYRLHADGHGLIWVSANVPHPDAPHLDDDTPIVRLEEASDDAIEYASYVMIEALTPDGRLVASARFDSIEDAPDPVEGNLWYRRTPDMLSIVILEVFLTELR